MNELSNLRLDYLIGAENYCPIVPKGRIVEVGYDALIKPSGPAIKYVNLFDENNTGRYGPYLTGNKRSGTARQYNEGHIDPKGSGWSRNLNEQFTLARRQSFEYAELDNPDAYSVTNVLDAIELAAIYELKVIAKNPLLCEEPSEYVGRVPHPNVRGAIVEAGAGSPLEMHELRDGADYPVWFVFFGGRKETARRCAAQIKDENIPNMFVTYSSKGEYGSSDDVT
jgi:hypothetical protein